jgi:polysaccharide deacetylase 2 family uncharacterized protein YibQ
VPRALPQIVSPARNVPDTRTRRPARTCRWPISTETRPRAEATVTVRHDRPAIEAFAAPFDRTETRPLISVILIDAPDDRLDIDTLTQFSFPVAFAIDPPVPDAAERAAAYRAAGFEVLMMASVIPEGATASDTEVALSVARARVPEAVALIDTPDSRVQSERMVLEAVSGRGRARGPGLHRLPAGPEHRRANGRAREVPAATLFRLLDDEDQRATVITRYLGRAEFAAAQEGAVDRRRTHAARHGDGAVLLGLGDRNEGVAIAPLSAVLRRLAEDAAPFLIAAAAAFAMLVMFLVMRLGNGRLIVRRRSVQANPFAYLGRFSGQPRLVTGWIFAVVRSCGWWVYVVYLPIYAVQNGLGSQLGGIALSITNAGLFLAPLMLRYMMRRSLRTTVRTGFLMSGLLFVLASVMSATPGVVIGLLMVGSLFLILLDVSAGLPFLLAVSRCAR